MEIEIRPTSYSKAQSAASIIEKLKKYPKQICNTPEAFKGLVMEFILNDGPDNGPVASLSELYEIDKCSRFLVYTGEGLLVVNRLDNGNFVVEKP